ncbi:helicase-exonuclease AddAB subunit AddA [Clostridium sediminicola]|uniref:helicase-exonuclease AddAB subunit AddA n=1 Tax=Clostridium sediminicola TaxID=3114879 RepID=UPI0031F276D9
MAKLSWTEDQQAAIDTHSCNLLVAAAAGSGKTAVLVERIIKRVTDIKNPLDIDRLLIVTFTKATASEMKERITKAINDRLDKNPNSKILQRQLTLINRASITTLHSFCLEVIRNNFHNIDIDPNFRIGDGTETLLLKTEVIEELFEELYQEENRKKEFEKLLDCYSGNKDDVRLQEMVMNLYNFAMSSPYPTKKLNDMAEAFNVGENFEFSKTEWAKVILQHVIIEIFGLEKIMLKALKTVEDSDELLNYAENFRDDLAILQDVKLAAKNSWEALFVSLEDAKFGKLKTCRGVEDKSTQKKVKESRDKVKKQLEKIKEDIRPYSSHQTMEDLKSLYPVMRELSDLVISFIERYGEKKKEKGIIDFNDFEHFALKILAHLDRKGNVIPTKAALNLRDKYDEILVDEYQDSNDVQETIINTISKKDKITGFANNVFMVGDVKQSIYRFRQAKPELFLQKYHAYVHQKSGNNNEEYENFPQRKITLYKNFRSRKEIINGVNFIFKGIMSKNVGELNYDDNEALNFGAHYEENKDDKVIVGGNIELHLINGEGKDIECELEEADNVQLDEEILTKIQVEARFTANRIKELINEKDGKTFKVFDNKLGEYRKLQFKDIVILLRTTSKWSEIFSEELKRAGIGSYSDVGTGYFKTVEINTILSLLQIIDNPRQDIPLIAVLRSPIASFTEEELIDIRRFGKDIDFYNAMRMLVDSKETDENDVTISIKRKCYNFLDKLKKWRKISIHMPIDEFIWKLYMETGYFGFVSAMSGGEQRQANLKILFQRAKQFQQTSYKGLFNFITFINKLKISSGDMGSAKILGENDNVVRIMSIHKSKGLEFPVVFLAGMGKQFNLQDLNKKILFHENLGYGPDFVDLDRRISYPTVLKQAIKKVIKVESLSEEMRVLYVALTRAKEKLIMSGVVNDIDKKVQKWELAAEADGEKLSEYDMVNAKTYLDWVIPSILRHKDRQLFCEDLEIGMTSRNLIEDKSKWEIKLWDKNDIIVNNTEIQNRIDEEKLEKIAKDERDIRLESEIDRRLSWKYNYSKATSMSTRFTVTELKKMQYVDTESDHSTNIFTHSMIEKPSFMESSDKIGASEKGTLVHFVMQKIDITRVSSIEEIREQINELVNKEFISDDEAQIINPYKILNFFKSDVGVRMLKADLVKSEVPFLIEMKSTEIYKELHEEEYGDEYILLQGIIDLFFQEGEEFVLVDYKTDFVNDNNLKEIKERYSIQLDYYASAIEKITGRKVKEKYLYLFGIDREVLIQ